jgi:hypothetical protein
VRRPFVGHKSGTEPLETIARPSPLLSQGYSSPRIYLCSTSFVGQLTHGVNSRSPARPESLPGLIALLGSSRRPSPKKDAHGYSPWALPLLGSNQDSPDPEGPQEPPKLQQLATLYASSCHPMLQLPASMLDFALLYSHKC